MKKVFEPGPLTSEAELFFLQLNLGHIFWTGRCRFPDFDDVFFPCVSSEKGLCWLKVEVYSDHPFGIPKVSYTFPTSQNLASVNPLPSVESLTPLKPTSRKSGVIISDKRAAFVEEESGSIYTDCYSRLYRIALNSTFYGTTLVVAEERLLFPEASWKSPEVDDCLREYGIKDFWPTGEGRTDPVVALEQAVLAKSEFAKNVLAAVLPDMSAKEKSGHPLIKSDVLPKSFSNLEFD